jgi:hypothetical protein
MRPRISRAWTSDRGGLPRVIAVLKIHPPNACTLLPDTGTQLPENTRLSTTVDIPGHSQGAGKTEFLKSPLFLHKADTKSLPSLVIRPKNKPSRLLRPQSGWHVIFKTRRAEALTDKSQSMSCPQPIHNFRIQTVSGTVLKKILGFACIRQSAVPLSQQLNGSIQEDIIEEREPPHGRGKSKIGANYRRQCAGCGRLLRLLQRRAARVEVEPEKVVERLVRYFVGPAMATIDDEAREIAGRLVPCFRTADRAIHGHSCVVRFSQ